MTDVTGNNGVHDALIVNTAELHVTIVPHSNGSAMSQQPPLCLRDNECSQQQLVRLVGHRDPAVSSAASWERLRRVQAALQGAS